MNMAENMLVFYIFAREHCPKIRHGGHIAFSLLVKIYSKSFYKLKLFGGNFQSHASQCKCNKAPENLPTSES